MTNEELDNKIVTAVFRCLTFFGIFMAGVGTERHCARLPQAPVPAVAPAPAPGPRTAEEHLNAFLDRLYPGYMTRTLVCDHGVAGERIPCTATLPNSQTTLVHNVWCPRVANPRGCSISQF